MLGMSTEQRWLCAKQIYKVTCWLAIPTKTWSGVSATIATVLSIKPFSIIERILPTIDPATLTVTDPAVIPHCPRCSGQVFMSGRIVRDSVDTEIVFSRMHEHGQH